jgi:hypothetical protein
VGHERLGERERPEVVGREGEVPSLRAAAGPVRHDAGIVEQAGDRKIERDDLCGRAPRARDVGQLANSPRP